MKLYRDDAKELSSEASHLPRDGKFGKCASSSNCHNCQKAHMTVLAVSDMTTFEKMSMRMGLGVRIRRWVHEALTITLAELGARPSRHSQPSCNLIHIVSR